MFQGAKFTDFQHFYSTLRQYEKTTFTNFWIRDSRSLEARKRAYPTSIASTARSELRYSYMRIFCRRGGRKVPRRGASNDGCPAGMCVRVTKCGNFLEVIQFNDEHNHEVSEALYKPPSNDKILKEIDLKLESAKKSECKITIIDIANLSKKLSMRKDLFECVHILKTIYHCDVQMLCDSVENVLCLFFQDTIMKNWLDVYPEIISIEAISCLHRKKGAVYVVMAEDSEGNNTNLAAVGIFLNDNEIVFDWFLKRLQTSSPRASDIKIIFTDTDSKKISAIKTNFPSAVVQISLFHIVKTFTKEVSPKCMKITAEECEESRQILKSLAEALLQCNYENEYEKLKNSAPKVVVNYFLKNWRPIRNQWASYQTYNKKTRKYDEYYSQLKLLCSEILNLEEFIKKLFMFLNSVRSNRNVINIQKVPSCLDSGDSAEESYRKLLTNYAFDKVQQQIEKMKDSSDVKSNKKKLSTVQLSPNSCDCWFWTAVALPCQHVLKDRELLNMSLFDRSLCGERWTRDYYEKHQSLLTVEMTDEDGSDLETSLYDSMTRNTLENREILINHKKFKIMSDECIKLSNLTSTVSDCTFFQRLEFLQGLIAKWTDTGDDTECSEAVGSVNLVDNENTE